MNLLPPISLLTVVPLVGALAVLTLGRRDSRMARTLAFAFAFLALAVVVVLWHWFNPTAGGLQFEEVHAWIPALGVEYHVGIDGLGLLMLLLSAIVVPMAMAASSRIVERVPLYFSLMLMLEAGLFGTFTALNFFHWFLFWELSLIPAFFLIRLWGGVQRAAAATQFFIYTMVGSVALLLAFLALFLCTGKFDFMDLATLAQSGQLLSSLASGFALHSLTAGKVGLLLCFGAFLGFAVKVPLIPFHTWLPNAYAEAPAGVTMLLTGTMSKMGVYGFLRILLPIFYAQLREVRTGLLWLAVATIVLSAYAALAQKDLKRIFAYSSINHLGYCMLGIFSVLKWTGDNPALGVEKAAALNGVFLQMFNHGLTAATLFWFVALLEKRSGGLRGLDDFGGLRKVAPVFCGMMGIALFSSLGLPGLNEFVGEFLIFKGTFPLASWPTSVSTLGLLLTAIFILTILQRVFSGPLNSKWAGMHDLTLSERIALAPPLVLMFVLGVYPQLVLGFTNSTVMQLVRHLRF
ncbi:NADH-quinone oxidoreductase subunit M [Edaphobacter sp.]|uniref:complex I subunit 4 family protein n=1 Tax=Edaphobacter sp. TaxID=1934404 RepID=UPI002DBA0E4A|nr:NADH-quinone oxidoreductase subunit M [Edaphobacter sp.]HEU5342350.1 NADH-quinone oxidoreductase subunit M [Edaphobacter sp.]